MRLGNSLLSYYGENKAFIVGSVIMETIRVNHVLVFLIDFGPTGRKA